jgi:hypothetical protein
MVWVQWRKRLFYAAASAFVVVHCATLLTGPMPDSVMKTGLLRVLHPYAAPLRLTSTWDFYAPGIGYGTQFRYTVEDSAGQGHTFAPADTISWFDPLYWWSSEWYKSVAKYPEDYATMAGLLLCREHESLRPVAVTLTAVQQKAFSVDDQKAGKRPTDPEFFDENTIERVECQDK